MHLCQVGIDTIYIRDILGHVDLKTTEIYAKINMEQVRGALEKAYPDGFPSQPLKKLKGEAFTKLNSNIFYA